jgi:hypothetical protein
MCVIRQFVCNSRERAKRINPLRQQSVISDVAEKEVNDGEENTLRPKLVSGKSGQVCGKQTHLATT